MGRATGLTMGSVLQKRDVGGQGWLPRGVHICVRCWGMDWTWLGKSITKTGKRERR